MNMSCLIRFRANILTLFKRLLTMEQMSMQKVKMKKSLLNVECGNNNDGVVSRVCMVLNLFFIFFT
jgi:hypothetical protein